MAGDIKLKYGTSGQSITCTLAGLTTGSMRQATAVDNSSNLFADALVSLQIKTGASGVSSTGYVQVYAAGSVDGGTSYSNGATGTDGAYTQATNNNLIPLGRIGVGANATTYVGGPWSVASVFGGSLPAKWSIIVDNETGAALDSTEANHVKQYQGVGAQYS